MEVKPKFIDSELQPYYEQTDLELFYVFDCCKSLKPLKSIDVNEQQIEFFYKEFIKMGWTKKDFNKQFEAVKRATLYNRLDLDIWLKTEIMYNEIDLSVKIKEVIENKIAQGRRLQNQDIVLSDEDKQSIDLYAADVARFRKNNDYYEKQEEYKQDRIKYWQKKLG